MGYRYSFEMEVCQAYKIIEEHARRKQEKKLIFRLKKFFK